MAYHPGNSGARCSTRAAVGRHQRAYPQRSGHRGRRFVREPRNAANRSLRQLVHGNGPGPPTLCGGPAEDMTPTRERLLRVPVPRRRDRHRRPGQSRRGCRLRCGSERRQLNVHRATGARGCQIGDRDVLSADASSEWSASGLRPGNSSGSRFAGGRGWSFPFARRAPRRPRSRSGVFGVLTRWNSGIDRIPFDEPARTSHSWATHLPLPKPAVPPRPLTSRQGNHHPVRLAWCARVA